VKTRVKRICVEKGRAAGVELESGEVVVARDVVCNADPAVAYGKLLAPEHCKRQIRAVKRMEYSVSLLSIFCAADMDLKGMGYDSGNYWWYRTTDVDGLYAQMERQAQAEIEGLFLAITTLKDPGHSPNGHHTIEMFTFMPYEPFVPWQAPGADIRGAQYQMWKRAFGEKMLVAAEKVIPGLRRHVKFLEIGTPLTNDFYCETYRGAVYGSAKTPWQVGPFSFSQRGPVEGLHLCGASTISHGVAGASMSGLVAAQHVLGRATTDELLGPPDGSLQTLPADHPEEWLTAAHPAMQNAAAAG
jgi:all-trans-retinol 13,14-reductase